ncbi:MAG: HNH endonuclease [Lachnospiraceae bacterium]|nr:HNH endonuclease [Lachnospiraceae bacterium]
MVDVSTKGGSFLEGGKNFVRGALFCKEHIHLQGKQYDKFERKYKHRERYDSRWDKVRNIYIKEHPLCEECLKENKSNIARIVHHIKPIEDGGDKYAFDNLMSVCDSCHQKIHTRLKKS